MALFRYEALNATGATLRGNIDAGTPAEARAALRDRGLHTKVVEPAVRQKPSDSVDNGSSMQVLSGHRLDLLSAFSRHLALLLKSGLPLAQGLAVLRDQIDDRRFGEVVEDIVVRVREGASLDEALSMHKRYFPDLFICVAKAGAASGHLPEILSATAGYYTRQKRLRDRVVSALTYPALMSLIGLFVVGFLLAFVVPKVTTVLLEEKRVLPWPTEVLLAVSGFVVQWWWLILAACFVLTLVARAAFRTEHGRYALDKWKLSIPILGDLFRKQAVSRWADTMSSLVASGIPVVQSLSVVKNALGNRLLADDVTALEKVVIDGSDLSEALKGSRHLPKSIGFVVGVGEETGELPRVLREVADSYNEEVEIVASRLTDMINPILIVVLGLIVGFIVAAILLPITDFSQIQ